MKHKNDTWDDRGDDECESEGIKMTPATMMEGRLTVQLLILTLLTIAMTTRTKMGRTTAYPH